jgi:hypothetical protein
MLEVLLWDVVGFKVDARTQHECRNGAGHAWHKLADPQRRT